MAVTTVEHFGDNVGICASVLALMTPDEDRLRRLKLLCDQLESFRKQAVELCRAANDELRRARLVGMRERRIRQKSVKTERRKAR
jgi:hypothetical protein